MKVNISEQCLTRRFALLGQVPRVCLSCAGLPSSREKVAECQTSVVLRSRETGGVCGTTPGELELMRMENQCMAACTGNY